MRAPQTGLLAVLATTAVAALAPAPAGARIIEIGQAARPNLPSCPTNPCQAVSRTTGYQAKVGTDRGLMTAPANGKIVAWSISLGSPGRRQIRFFNENYGGASQAGISILKPGTRLFHRVTGQSPMQSLEPYFGTTVQFPLGTALNVKKGYVIGLTVPSWAPGRQSAQLDLRDLAQYRCLYRTARLTYSATLITSPKPPKKKR